MTDDTRQALAMITQLIDALGARLEGAFATFDQHHPLADQVRLLHAEFSNLTAAERAKRYLTVMALLKRDKTALEAARYDQPAAVFMWRRLLALPAHFRAEVLGEWAEWLLLDAED
jgi:hypothetical protein